MIKVENIEVFGWEAAIRGMRNPMNSWDKSDSDFLKYSGSLVKVGENDLKLMKSLVKAGSDHRKFLRMINVTCDITAPLYWWKEFDTYKVGTVANSCSTMHKIHDKEFTLDDFSHEHLEDMSLVALEHSINMLNYNRRCYNEISDTDHETAKHFWWQMIQLLPSSYNQKRTVQLNYEVLLNMYHSRNNHKLDEWRSFCETIKKLQYMEELI